MLAPNSEWIIRQSQFWFRGFIAITFFYFFLTAGIIALNPAEELWPILAMATTSLSVAYGSLSAVLRDAYRKNGLPAYLEDELDMPKVIAVGFGITAVILSAISLLNQ